jgi:diguanylate cyclase (GGDEF)-like protein
MKAMQFGYRQLRLQVTASIGLAGVLPGDDPVSLLRRADHALQTSKASGGNCSHMHDGRGFRRVSRRPRSKPRLPVEPPAGERLHPQLLFKLPDRGRFERVLARHIAESHAQALPLSVLFLEVADIAQVAEDHGRPVSDLVLDEVARRLQNAIRTTDYLFFWDEDGPFAVILPGSTAAEAGRIAARIKASCAEAKVRAGQVAGPVSFRIGFASCQDEDDLASLCERAELKTHCDSPTVLV